jgi:hypothetical protein
MLLKGGLLMITFIPKRYSEPKWQAFITEIEKQFRFINGVQINSLFELKQALLTLPEEVITHHVNDNNNDLANWVEFVCNHKQLAEAMRQYQHRWGMIVALEREQMRTLNLPPFVAHYWLRQVDLPFTFVSGETVKSLADLKTALEQVNDETIQFHLEREPNDIAKWVNDIIGDYELSELLAESTNHLQMSRFVEDHLIKLEETLHCEH